MLEKSTQNCYYQSGIGTFVPDLHRAIFPLGNIRHVWQEFWKAVDTVAGYSLEAHVIEAYAYLMKTVNSMEKVRTRKEIGYRSNNNNTNSKTESSSKKDDSSASNSGTRSSCCPVVSIFGFSRGALAARVLAAMVEHIGLLREGSEHLVPTAWALYVRWEGAEQPQGSQKALLAQFKRTFSRDFPIHFLGLWDTVNSVGILREWVFPYSQSVSAVRHVRHAVSIDERRAKYKAMEINTNSSEVDSGEVGEITENGAAQKNDATGMGAKIHCGETVNGEKKRNDNFKGESQRQAQSHNSSPPDFLDSPDLALGESSTSSDSFLPCIIPESISSIGRFPRFKNFARRFMRVNPTIQKSVAQKRCHDSVEVWFSGDHGDIGGGWPSNSEGHRLSDVTLQWMVENAMQFGVKFRKRELAKLDRNVPLQIATLCHHDVLAMSCKGCKMSVGRDWR